MRHLSAIVSITLLFAMLCAPAFSKANPKYASLVIDTKRGIVLHERNANAKRHPASLTKMMTIYLTLEAIDEGRLSWNTKMRASKRAAAQPQTNISLKKGDALLVKQAVRALIVRSANDAAVVLAEHLGKTEWNFALMMTQKARALGMSDTTFKNAHGLHNSKQVTTASDMAKLSFALRKHFGHHYHLFKTIKFTFKGRTYYSHNKITRYYKGADGLKTGYINASGFNLATSATRNGTSLIGVVLGGKSGKSRNSHMRELLDSAFGRLNKPFFKRFAQAIPRPTGAKPPSLGGDNNDAILSVASLDAARILPNKSPAAMVLPFHGSTPTPKLKPQSTEIAANILGTDDTPTPAQKPQKPSPEVAAKAPTAPPLLAAKPLTKPLAKLVTASTAVTPPNWGVQVGTFSHPKDAMIAAANAISIASGELGASEINVARVGANHGLLHRARLTGVSENQARQACRILISQKEPCFVFKAVSNSL